MGYGYCTALPHTWRIPVLREVAPAVFLLTCLYFLYVHPFLTVLLLLYPYRRSMDCQEANPTVAAGWKAWQAFSVTLCSFHQLWGQSSLVGWRVESSLSFSYSACHWYLLAQIQWRFQSFDYWFLLSGCRLMTNQNFVQGDIDIGLNISDIWYWTFQFDIGLDFDFGLTNPI